jgi:AcrR family transcriptional regulator
MVVAMVTPEGKGAHTRRVILDAAITRFGRDGYRATSVADIARDAGVGGTVAYAYFPGKEALFLAAVDEDAAAVIQEGLATAFGVPHLPDWPQQLIAALLAALDHHPLARRLLAGREPEVTVRVLEIPALNELRKVCAELIRVEQVEGLVRPDVDPVSIANGVVAIVLSLLMSVVQLGPQAVDLYGADVAAVLQAAIEPAPAAASSGAAAVPGPGSGVPAGPARRRRR